MISKESVSDELLNAFIDNELDKPERERVLEQVEQDQLVAQRLCELTRLKELVRMARPEPEEFQQISVPAARQYHLGSYAALLLLAFSFSLFLFLDMPGSKVVTVNDQALQSIIEKQANAVELKVVMQVTRADDALIVNMLDQTEALLNMQKQLNKPVRVEIVAAGKGLDLLRSDKSPYASRIHLLRQKYDNLLFVACQETLQKVQNNTQQQIPIINGIAMVHSGSGEVQLRRSQGWSVIKI